MGKYWASRAIGLSRSSEGQDGHPARALPAQDRELLFIERSQHFFKNFPRATTVRYKGRNLRIKAPMCRALKKLCDPDGM